MDNGKYYSGLIFFQFEEDESRDLKEDASQLLVRSSGRLIKVAWGAR